MSDSPPRWNFPIARKLLRFARRAARAWRDRHQHPFNFAIHLVGIPLAFAGLGLFVVAPWEWAAAALVGGYVLQWVGHLVEGNDVGELIPLKKLVGLRTVSVAPRYAAPPDATSPVR